MKLKGILDFSLGNFLCLRGFAPMGILQDISKIDENIQRIPKKERLREIEDFLKRGEFVFFPEVILCVCLHEGDEESQNVANFFISVQQGNSFRKIKFEHDLRISSTVSRSKRSEDIRAVKFFQTATLEFNEIGEKIFSRIDGNHRLAATTEASVRERTTPFCIIFFRNGTESRRFSRALFHIINYKQIQLPKEHNLKLILGDKDLFSDDKLKNDPSFGWPYYLARQLYDKLDFDLLPNLKPFIEKEPRSFFVDQFIFLLEKGVLGDNENAIKRLKGALVHVNSLFDSQPALKDSKNLGLIAALVYYELKSSFPTASFVHWVLDNNLHLIKESTSSTDLIQIFDKVLESRKRTLFVSMKFGNAVSEGHYRTIERICKEITTAYKLKPELKPQRVDWFDDGTSYVITEKIVEMICDCGLLIGDLTFSNPNVYHEIGFIMGKAKAENRDTADILLFLDESVPDEKNKFVGFNLRNMKYISFSNNEEFGERLSINLKRFYHL